MAINKAGCEYAVKYFYPVTCIFNIYDILDNTLLVCYQYPTTGQYFMPCKNLICPEFSIQVD